MKSIALVLDQHFGEKLFKLAGRMPVWIVSSPDNLRAIRTTREALGRRADITELLPGSSERPKHVLARGLYSIEQHHGADSGKAYQEVLVLGAHVEDVGDELLAELGFKRVRRAESGFKVER